MKRGRGRADRLSADRLAVASEFVEALEDPEHRHGQGVGAEGGETAGAGARFWKTSAAALAVVTVVLSAWLAFGPRPAAHETRIFKAPLQLPEGPEVMTAQFGSSVALSPDGSRLVYAGSSDDARWQLWIRPADELEATPLPGTAASWSPQRARPSRFILERLFQGACELFDQSPSSASTSSSASPVRASRASSTKRYPM